MDVAASCHVRASTRELKPSKYTFGGAGVEPYCNAFSKACASRASTEKYVRGRNEAEEEAKDKEDSQPPFFCFSCSTTWMMGWTLTSTNFVVIFLLLRFLPWSSLSSYHCSREYLLLVLPLPLPAGVRVARETRLHLGSCLLPGPIPTGPHSHKFLCCGVVAVAMFCLFVGCGVCKSEYLHSRFDRHEPFFASFCPEEEEIKKS